MEAAAMADGEKVAATLQAGLALADAADGVLEALADLQKSTGVFTSDFGDRLESVLDVWEGELPGVLTAFDALNTGDGTKYALEPSAVLGMDSDHIRERVVWSRQAAALARNILGLDGPKMWLVLGQDNGEIRPTGGFIGMAAEVGLSGGQIESMTVHNSYDIDPPTYKGVPIGPPTFSKYMAGRTAYQAFRDSNWSPDFPTSAEAALRIYNLSPRPKVDGVIGLDTQVLADLIDILGPLDLPGWNKPVNGTDARELASGVLYSNPYTCGPGAKFVTTDRCFVSDALDVILAKLRTSKIDFRIVQVLLRALDQKHLLVYSLDPAINALLSDMGWDGHLTPPGKDYLAAFEWSAYSKAFDDIYRSYTYSVEVHADTSASGHLRIDYANKAPYKDPCLMQSLGDPRLCYYSYARFYVPKGAVLRSIPFFPLPPGTVASEMVPGDPAKHNTLEQYTEGDYRVFGVFIRLGMDESTTLEFQYTLPPGTLEKLPDGRWRYRLVLQKMPGSTAEPITAYVTLPQGAELLGGTVPAQSDGARLTFQTTLLTDQEIVVLMRLPV
jgi:hypothetical protein